MRFLHEVSDFFMEVGDFSRRNPGPFECRRSFRGSDIKRTKPYFLLMVRTMGFPTSESLENGGSMKTGGNHDSARALKFRNQLYWCFG